MRNNPRVRGERSSRSIQVGEGNRAVQKGQIAAHAWLADDLVPAERLHGGSTLGSFGRFRVLFDRLAHPGAPVAGSQLSHSLPWPCTSGRSPPETVARGRTWLRSRRYGWPAARGF